MAAVGADEHDIIGWSTTDPYSYFRFLRETDPVHRTSDSGVWLVTRHSDCLGVLRDPRFSASLGQACRRRADGLPPSMLCSDPPDHQRLRRPAALLFTEERLAVIRTRLDTFVDLLLEHASQHETFDGIADFAEPIALLTLTSFLGVPKQDVPEFAQLSRRAAINLDPLTNFDTRSPGPKAATDLADYLRTMLIRGRATDGSAIATLGYELEAGASDLDVEDVVAALCLFVIGGYEPLVSVVGNGMYSLLTHPTEHARLRADTMLLSRAVDELMRWESPIPFTARVCVEDLVLAKQELAAGDVVVLLLAAANRDPEVFDDSERLDVGRHPNPMLAFGSGIHRCVAAPLARVVGESAIGRFVLRAPTAELAGEAVSWRAARVPRGLVRLPLRLGALVLS